MSMQFVHILCSCLTSSLLFAASPGGEINIAAGDSEPLVLTRFEEDDHSVRIDGHIDESIWLGVEPINDLRVLTPDTRERPLYQTDVRFIYSDKGLYAAFVMEQPDHATARRITATDARLVSRDYVSFTIDTSGQGLYGYWMGLALGDNQLDGTILPERRFGSDWDGAWYGSTQKTPTGWSAEFYIPWSQTAMP